MTTQQIPFALATARISGSPAFPLVILDDEAAISLEALAPLAAKLGQALTHTATLQGVLQDWDRNFTALCAAVSGLNDPAMGKYARSSVTAIEFFDLQAPLAMQRQVYFAGDPISLQPATALAGPKAKVPIPPGADHLMAGLAMAIVIGAPTYRPTEAEAQGAIAGYAVATRYCLPNGDTWAPTFLPIGPMLVPAPFCAAQTQGRIAFNGETGRDGAFGTDQAVAAIREVAMRAQLFPGDLIICPMGEFCDQGLRDGDIIETAIAGLGQQTTNIMVESKHAHPGN